MKAMTQKSPLNNKNGLFLNCWVTGKDQSTENPYLTGSLETLCAEKTRIAVEM